MFELQSNKLAEERGTAAEKAFAATMIKDHTKTSDELKTLVKNGDVKEELPTSIDSSHQSKLDKLSGYKRTDFGSEFGSQQVNAHEDAVSLFERYSNGGENPKLKDRAGKTLPV
jgi:putative membrane protein